MRVQDVMRTEPRHCAPTDTLATAGAIMAEVGAGVLPVIDAGGRVVGMITDRDICCALTRGDLKPSALTVGRVMSGIVHSCQGHQDLRQALATMRAHKVRRLPVVDAAGRLHGILSLDDVVLEARLFETIEFHGPLYADIVDTLREIVRHAPPALVG